MGDRSSPEGFSQGKMNYPCVGVERKGLGESSVSEMSTHEHWGQGNWLSIRGLKTWKKKKATSFQEDRKLGNSKTSSASLPQVACGLPIYSCGIASRGG